MWKLNTDEDIKTKELRIIFRETLEEMIDENDKIIVLDADLGGASSFSKIKNSHPENYVGMGIAEANMIGVAAGLSMRGFIPYVHTFCPFASRRVADQVFLEGAYAHNTINIYGSDPGICAAANGGTHTSFEDIALYRAIPNVIVLNPADDVQLKWVVKEVSKIEGVHYIRANRKNVARVYEEGSTFEIGKGNVLTNGSDVLIVTMGILVKEALDAINELKAKSISATIIDMFTIKPLDADLIKKEMQGKKLVVTFENHNVINGLGSAVAEVMAENPVNVPLVRIGCQDKFGQVGSFDYLKEEYGLTKNNLINTIVNKLK